ncbi:hypothetical protein VTK26DRAFT_149 [Humicola hyalothermophila]
MFLHAGAGLHGHEYSNRPSNAQAAHNLRPPLLRSALTPTKQRARTADGAVASLLRQRPVSDYIPREPLPVVRFRIPQEDDDPPPPTPATHDEPISDSELSDAPHSIEGPAGVAGRSSYRRRSSRPPRKSTTYCLGYPTPRIIGKTKVVRKVLLPRLLLQLQQVGQDGRSYPVLEVFPAARIAGPVVAPRLARRFPGIFGAKRHLGYDDIVLVRRDDGDLASDGTESEDEEELEKRNILAVYSPLKHSDEAEIVLDDGSIWVAKPLANGSYDFVHTDPKGTTTTARWARRHTPAATQTSVSSGPSIPSNPPPPRYTFSIINPLTRRHPVMATLTPSSLTVQDTYTSVSPSHGRHPPITRISRSQSVTSSVPPATHAAPASPSHTSTTDNCESDSGISIPSSPDPDSAAQRTVHQIDAPTKLLISVTALWVALRAGWSQSHSPGSETASASTPSTPASPTSTPATVITSLPCASRAGRRRRNTWTRSSTYDAAQSQPGEGSSSSARSPSPAAPAHLSRIATFKRHSLPAQETQSHKQQHRLSSLCCSTSVPSTPLTGSRTSTPVSLVSVAVGAGAAGAGGDERSRHGNGSACYGSDGEAVMAPRQPRRATSTGAAYMQRRLLATSSSSSALSVGAAGPKGAAAESGVVPLAGHDSLYADPEGTRRKTGRRKADPPNPPYPPPPPPATTAQVQTKQALLPPPGNKGGGAETAQVRVVSPRVAAAAAAAAGKAGVGLKKKRDGVGISLFEEGHDGGVYSGVGGGKRGGGVRSRLSRWIHRIGGGSR